MATFTEAQLKTIVEQAVSAALQANQVQAQPDPFMMDPSLPNDDPWDYSTSHGVKIYMAAITPLTVKFDGKEASLQAFLNAIFLRGESLGFSLIFWVNDGQGIKISLIEEFE